MIVSIFTTIEVFGPPNVRTLETITLLFATGQRTRQQQKQLLPVFESSSLLHLVADDGGRKAVHEPWLHRPKEISDERCKY